MASEKEKDERWKKWEKRKEKYKACCSMYVFGGFFSR